MSASATQTAVSTRAADAHIATDATPFPETVFRFLSVSLTITLPALLCLCVAYVSEPDIWWHISSGDWILRHHALPHIDHFSSTTMGHPWQAYSWLFDVMLSLIFRHLGLTGIVVYSTGMVLLITAAIFYLVQSAQRSLRISLPLTVAGSLALLTLYSPRPWHFTIFFFLLEVAIVQNARRRGGTKQLLWLPLLFTLWANLHIQFVDGLLFLILVVLDSVFARNQEGFRCTRIPPRIALALLAACITSTLVNPYSWHIYTVAHDLAAQRGVLNSIEELKAMPFRAPSNYIVLFLTLGAGAALARRRSLPFFETALLLTSAVLSFRSQRDIWLVVAASMLILSQPSEVTQGEETVSSTEKGLLPACACAVLLLVGSASLIKLSRSNLQPKLDAAMPVRAAAFIRERGMSGPVFCDFVWGGFLMHSLGLPVSMDGRAALHGDEQMERSARTWAGAPEWHTNPQLIAAGIVVAPTSAALTQLLRTDSRFDRVYEDQVAVVFTPHIAQGSTPVPVD